MALRFRIYVFVLLLVSCLSFPFPYNASFAQDAGELKASGRSLSLAVLFSRNQFPDWKKLVSEFKRRWKDADEVRSYQLDKQGVSFSVGDTLVTVSASSRPMRNGAGKLALTGSWWWRNAAADIGLHKGFVSIRVSPLRDGMLKAHKILTVTTSLVLQSPESYGVYYRSAELVMPRDLYLSEVQNLQSAYLPLMLWVKTYVSEKRNRRGKKVLTARTVGLKNFGLMEIETENAPMDVQGFQSMLWGLASYLIQRGPVIYHGHTIGRTENERIRVLHQNSVFGSGEKVYLLRFP